MKAILLAVGMTLLVTLILTALFRNISETRARNATILYFVAAVCLALLWDWTPPNLGFLPSGLVAEPSWLDAIAAQFFFAAAFFGGVLQIYNLADRGFSLRILIDLKEADEPVRDARWVLRAYSGGQGIDWMYRKRLSGMLDGGFVIYDHDLVVLTATGRRTAAIFKNLRRLAKLEEPTG